MKKPSLFIVIILFFSPLLGNNSNSIPTEHPIEGEITMLFAYTTQAACAVGGPAKIKENVENGLKLLNEALSNSLIGYQVRAIPVYVEVEYASVPNKEAVGELLRELRKTDGKFNKVHQFRKQKQADMVCLIFSGYGMGQADLNGDMMVSHYSTFGSSYVFPHEFGHNLGATHEAGTRFYFGQTRYRTVSNNDGVSIPYYSDDRSINHTEDGITKPISLGDAYHNNAGTMRKNAPEKAMLGENLVDVPSISNPLPASLVDPATASMPGCLKESVTIDKCFIDDTGLLTIEYNAVDEVSFNAVLEDKDGNKIENTGFGTNLKPGESKFENRFLIATEPGDKYIININDKKLECPVGQMAASSATIVTIDESTVKPTTPIITSPDKPKTTTEEPTSPNTPNNQSETSIDASQTLVATGNVSSLNRPGDPFYTHMDVNKKGNIVSTTVANKTAFMITQPDKAQAFLNYEAIDGKWQNAIKTLGYKDITPISQTDGFMTGDTYTVTYEGGKLVWKFSRSGLLVASFSVDYKTDSSIGSKTPPDKGGSSTTNETARASLENVAKGKIASQSTTVYDQNGTASNAVDGNTNGIWAWGQNSITHTAEQDNPWWEVDLGGIYDISEIKIWNRIDQCCWQRLQNFYVMVSEKPIFISSTTTDQYSPGPLNFTSGSEESISLKNNRRGRYVRILLAGNKKILSLSEVEVFGKLVSTASPSIQNISKGKQARQSSTAYGGDPERALDGNSDGRWGYRSVTHTNGEKAAWWEVDLGEVYEIDRIVIWNREDCCWERLQNFLVLTSESPIKEQASGNVFGDGALKGPFSPWSSGISSFTIDFEEEPRKKARYIRITLRQQMQDRPLSLAEVEVYGSKP